MQKRKNSFHFLNPFKFLFLFVCLWKKIGHLMLGKFFLLVLRDCFKNIQRDLLLSFHVFISLIIQKYFFFLRYAIKFLLLHLGRSILQRKVFLLLFKINSLLFFQKLLILLFFLNISLLPLQSRFFI